MTKPKIIRTNEIKTNTTQGEHLFHMQIVVDAGVGDESISLVDAGTSDWCGHNYHVNNKKKKTKKLSR